jgi:hypothetical protein
MQRSWVNVTISLLATMVRRSNRSNHLAMALVASAITTGAAAIPVAAAASPAPASAQAQLFGVHPIQMGQTTLPGGHFNFALVPGQSLSDGVVVENFSDHPLAFQVYGADLLPASGGGVAPAQRTDTMQEAGAWIGVSTPTVTIPGHSRFTDRFSITLPSMVSPGEHFGAIVAAAIVGTNPQGNSIEARTALTTVITVPGTVNPAASLSALSRSTAGPQQLGFEITLSNTGNLLLTYAGSVEIYDGADHKVATLPLTPPDAYVVPGGHVALAALWKDSIPKAGNYTARATVNIMANGKPVTTLTSQTLQLPFSSGVPILPIAGFGLGVLILLVASSLTIRRSRNRRRMLVGTGREARPGAIPNRAERIFGLGLED